MYFWSILLGGVPSNQENVEKLPILGENGEKRPLPVVCTGWKRHQSIPQKILHKKCIFDLYYSAAFQITSYSVEKVPILGENGEKRPLPVVCTEWKHHQSIPQKILHKKNVFLIFITLQRSKYPARMWKKSQF